MSETKICPVCGAQFEITTAAGRRRVTCGREVCRKKRRQALRLARESGAIPEITGRTCAICGRSIDDRPGYTKICADPGCVKAYKLLLNRNRYRAQKGTEGLGERVCPACGKKFMQHHGFQKYCSAACRESTKVRKNVARVRNRRQEYRAQVQEARACAWCGESFTTIDPRQRCCCGACSDAMLDFERDKIQSGKHADEIWKKRIQNGLDFTADVRFDGFGIEDPLCTPLEGLRELAWGFGAQEVRPC